jgi:hypothetical protein
MGPVVKQTKMLGLIIWLLAVVLAINDAFHPTEAFTFLPSPKPVPSPAGHHGHTAVPSTVRHEKGYSTILTSTLNVLEEDNLDNYHVDDSNTPLTETEWSQIESLQVEMLHNEKAQLGDVIMSTSVGGTGTVVLSCLSHYGDYNAWEMTQQYMSAIKSGRLSENW